MVGLAARDEGGGGGEVPVLDLGARKEVEEVAGSSGGGWGG